MTIFNSVKTKQNTFPALIQEGEIWTVFPPLPSGQHPERRAVRSLGVRGLQRFLQPPRRLTGQTFRSSWENIEVQNLETL